MVQIFQNIGFISLPNIEGLNFYICFNPSDGWFIAFSDRQNDFLFEYAKLNKDILFKKLLGYNPPTYGFWPYTHTREETLKLLYYLDSYINNKHFIHLCM